MIVFRTGLLFLILFATPVQTFAIDTHEELFNAVQSCISVLGEREIDDAQTVNLHCPRLGEQLQNSFLGETSFDDRFAKLTYREVLDIEKLFAARINPEPARVSFLYTNLDQFLSDTLVVDANAKKIGWWERFLAWLEDKIRTQDDADLKWLEDILKALTFSEETRKFILYGSFAIIVLLALSIVVNELKAGGLFRRRTRSRLSTSSQTSAGSNMTDVELLTTDSIQKMPQQMQPQALLSMCIDQLIRCGKLPDDRSRTNREFLKLFGSGGNQTVTRSFQDLVERAERSLYGGEQLSAEALARCFEESNRLLGLPAKSNA